MVYRMLADVVVVGHIGFVLFVGLGGFVAWRWLRVMPLHLAAVLWSVGIVTIGWNCPLTPLENWLRRLGGETSYEAGFVDRYLENVVYPGSFTLTCARRRWSPSSCRGPGGGHAADVV